MFESFKWMKASAFRSSILGLQIHDPDHGCFNLVGGTQIEPEVEVQHKACEPSRQGKRVVICGKTHKPLRHGRKCKDRQDKGVFLDWDTDHDDIVGVTLKT